ERNPGADQPGQQDQGAQRDACLVRTRQRLPTAVGRLADYPRIPALLPHSAEPAGAWSSWERLPIPAAPLTCHRRSLWSVLTRRSRFFEGDHYARGHHAEVVVCHGEEDKGASGEWFRRE